MVVADITAAMETLARGILEFVNYGITIITILIVIEFGRLVIHFTKGSAVAAGSAAASGSGKLFGWLKGKGAVPFTKERADKLRKQEKRALDLEMSEFIPESEELKIVKKIEQDIDMINYSKNHLLGLIPTDTTAEQKFHGVGGEITQARNDIDQATRVWHQVKRSTFRYQIRMNKLVNELEKNQDIPANEIAAMRALEGEILKKHQATEGVRGQLLVALVKMEEGMIKSIRAAENSNKTVPPSFFVTDAKDELRKYNPFFTEAVKLAGDMKNLQLGVIKDLDGLVVQTKGLM